MQTQHGKHKMIDWPDSSALTNSTLRDSQDSSGNIWEAILTIPGVRNWRILRDAAFLLTSFPLGLAAFMVAIIGGILGLSLSWMLIGIPILIWTMGFVLRFATLERERLETLLGVDLGEPNYPANNGENFLWHLAAVMKSSQVRSDLLYMSLLFPISIVELVLVLLPLEFFIPSFLHLLFGSTLSLDVLGIALNSRPEALLFVGMGVILLVPMLFLINIGTNAHVNLAKRLLQRKI